jgi:hypothetical protein
VTGWGCSSWTFGSGSCRCRSLSWSVTVVQVAERNHRARSKGVEHVDVEDNSCLKHVKRMSTQSSPTCYANYRRIFCPTSRSELLCVRELRGSTRDTDLYWFRYEVPYVQWRLLLLRACARVYRVLMSLLRVGSKLWDAKMANRSPLPSLYSLAVGFHMEYQSI